MKREARLRRHAVRARRKVVAAELPRASLYLYARIAGDHFEAVLREAFDPIFDLLRKFS
jgi:hypothetical protein